MSLSRIGSRTALAVLSILVLRTGIALAEGDAKAGAKATGKPEAVVRSYLGAMQKGDFKTAYGLLTPDMRADLDEEKWIAQQTVVMKVGEVEINSFRVFDAKVEGDKAIVPNLLKSRDKYINQTGADEYELYTLVRGDDGRWRIDQQELVETDAVAKWFPPGIRDE